MADIDVPLPGSGDDDMAGTDDRFAAAEQTVILTLSQGFSAAAVRRADGADALAEFVRLGHDARRDRMNQSDSFAFQVAREAGSGRTRVESNTPAGSQIVGGGS